MARSALGAATTVVSALALLLAVLGSRSEADTRTELVRVPALAGAVTWMGIVRLAPGGVRGRGQGTVPESSPQVHPRPPALTETVPGGSGSPAAPGVARPRPARAAEPGPGGRLPPRARGVGGIRPAIGDGDRVGQGLQPVDGVGRVRHEGGEIGVGSRALPEAAVEGVGPSRHARPRIRLA